MKRFVKVVSGAVLSFVILGFAGCSQIQNAADDYFSEKDDSSDYSSSEEKVQTSIYSDFENYPLGKQSTNGLLTLTNDANTAVLVFTDSVCSQNYIGTIPALSSIKVSLNVGKFYSIVAVTKEAYEKDSALATQTSVLVYYSDVQAYSVSVSPENMTGSATWIFNNHTNYWVSVEKIDGSGETFAVIAPNAKLVRVPVQTNQNYDYRVVYKKQLKYNGNIIAVSNKTSSTENDTASFMNLTTFTTDLFGDATKDNSDLAPTVKFINQTGKTLRVYNGQVQLTDTGIQSEDYALPSGLSAFFTGFSEGAVLSDLNVRNVAWDRNYYCCDFNTTLENGKVYIITVYTQKTYYGSSYNSSSNNQNLIWALQVSEANKFYTEE